MSRDLGSFPIKNSLLSAKPRNSDATSWLLNPQKGEGLGRRVDPGVQKVVKARDGLPETSRDFGFFGKLVSCFRKAKLPKTSGRLQKDKRAKFPASLRKQNGRYLHQTFPQKIGRNLPSKTNNNIRKTPKKHLRPTKTPQKLRIKQLKNTDNSKKNMKTSTKNM